ncbi:Peptidase M48 [Corchorus capsularis]|uniref:Peptidase M48 n=1 Tax=Corchorus capsularis TaxID=210143 RepID=A0A1R3IAF4_COCAP|nr:Peptidase M48 [Corchorus capsularis]
MEFPVIQAVVGSMIALYVFEMYLEMRQYALLNKTKDKKEMKRSSTYIIKKSHMRFVHETTTTIIDCIMLSCNLLPWLWKISGEFVLYVGFNAESEILHSLYSWLLFVFRLRFMNCHIPCTQLLSLRLLMAAIRKEVHFWHSIYGYWIVSFVIALGLSIVYPHLIAPLFNKYTRLRDGELRNKIKVLASSVGFPLEEIFVEDGSTRTTHSNHVAMPPQRLISFLMNFLSRYSEFQADAFAKLLGLGDALKEAMPKLRVLNKNNPKP